MNQNATLNRPFDFRSTSFDNLGVVLVESVVRGLLLLMNILDRFNKIRSVLNAMIKSLATILFRENSSII